MVVVTTVVAYQVRQLEGAEEEASNSSLSQVAKSGVWGGVRNFGR